MRRKERAHKINTDINANQIRLIGNGEPQILSTNEALKLARDSEMDLIMISESGDTPICRIEEYSKFLYNIIKKQKEMRKNSTKAETKEIKLGWNIDENDLKTKAKKALEFLADGDKVKCVIQLKGRQNAMPEKGKLVMLNFAMMVEEIGAPETFPELTGNKWLMTLKPKPKEKKK
jgi:translation initiation factor IF-3